MKLKSALIRLLFENDCYSEEFIDELSKQTIFAQAAEGCLYKLLDYGGGTMLERGTTQFVGSKNGEPVCFCCLLVVKEKSRDVEKALIYIGREQWIREISAPISQALKQENARAAENDQREKIEFDFGPYHATITRRVDKEPHPFHVRLIPADSSHPPLTLQMKAQNWVQAEKDAKAMLGGISEICRGAPRNVLRELLARGEESIRDSVEKN
jgi:hypothetical protein